MEQQEKTREEEQDRQRYRDAAAERLFIGSLRALVAQIVHTADDATVPLPPSWDGSDDANWQSKMAAFDRAAQFRIVATRRLNSVARALASLTGGDAK